MSIITPQYIAYDAPPLTYAAVSSSDLIPSLVGAVVLHIFNAGETDDVVVFYTTGTTPPDTSVLVEAGSEVLIGPFDYTAFAPSLTVTHSATEDVYIAAFFTELVLVETAIAIATEVVVATRNLIPIEAVELTTVNGTFGTTPTILAGILPSALTIEQGE